MPDDIDALVHQARAGSHEALESLVLRVKDRVYALAIRFLAEPADAQDATQEILIKLITKLDKFRGDSSFTTWVYRVASNHLLDVRKMRRPEVGFDELGQLLDAEVAAAEGKPAATDLLLIDEVKLFCTHGMLLCLDRPHRLAYVLGEILELSGDVGAEILGISPAAFRKRLSRARESMEAFVGPRCGLANPDNPCSCSAMADASMRHGFVDRDRLRYVGHPVAEAAQVTLQIDRLRSAAEMFRSHPSYATTPAFTQSIRTLLDRVNAKT